MEIAQVKKERSQLEADITSLLWNFSRKTKTEVADVDVKAVLELGFELPVTYLVKVEVRI